MPVLLRGTWHGVLRIVANSRNARPHSVVCLLFRFQRPSTGRPRKRDSCLESELDRRGVAKTTVLRQVGEWIYFHFPASSRRVFSQSATGIPSKPCGTPMIPGRSVPVKRGLLRARPSLGDPSRGGQLLLPSCSPVNHQRKNTGLPATFLPSACGSSIELGGAASNRFAQARQESTRPVRLGSFRDASGRSRHLALSPGPVKDSAGVRSVQRSQRPGSTPAGRSRSATAAAPSSRRPASRARSCATTASSCRSAPSRSSFTMR